MKKIRFGELSINTLFIFSGQILKKISSNSAESKTQQQFLFTDGTLVTLKEHTDGTVMSNEDFIKYVTILKGVRKIRC